MTSKTRKKKYGRYTKKRKARLTKKQTLIGGKKNIVEDNIIRSIISRSALDYNVKTGKLLKAYLPDLTNTLKKLKDPHFKRKLKFINNFFVDNGKFEEIPDLVVDMGIIIEPFTTDASKITLDSINSIKMFLENHYEYIKDYNGYTGLKEIIDKYITPTPPSQMSPTDQVSIVNYCKDLIKSINENTFTYNMQKFAKKMKYKLASDVRKIDESLAEMLYYHNKKYNPDKTACPADATGKPDPTCEIPEKTENFQTRIKYPI